MLGHQLGPREMENKPRVLYSPTMSRDRGPLRLLFWTLRLSIIPAVGGLMFVFREQVIAFAEDVLNLHFAYVDGAVHLLGTWQSRSIFVVVFFLVALAIFAWANVARSLLTGLILPGGVIFLLITLSYRMSGRGRPWLWAIPLAALVAANSLSSRMLPKVLPSEALRKIVRTILLMLPGSEIFLPRLFAASFVGEWSETECRIPLRWKAVAWVLGAGLPAVLWCSLFSYKQLVPLERKWFADPSVKVFTVEGKDFLEDFDLNDIALDKAANQILVAGVNSSRLLAINLADRSKIRDYSPTGHAEFFAFEPQRRELIFYDKVNLLLKVIDIDTVQLKRSIPLELAWGCSWIAYDTKSERLVVGSEAARSGRPGAVLDMRSGQEITALPFAPGYMIKHPEKPLAYVSFFWRESKILRFNIDELKLDRSVPSPPRLDRIKFDLKRGEILVAAALRSALLRYDAETLESKGTISTVFGVRTHEVDATRDLVLTGSLLTNQLEVVDLATHERLARYRLGPHLRSIALDTERGIAYVSSRFGLFEVSYLDRLPERYRKVRSDK